MTERRNEMMDAKRELIRIINKALAECLHEEFPNAKVEIEQHRIEKIAQAIVDAGFVKFRNTDLMSVKVEQRLS